MPSEPHTPSLGALRADIRDFNDEYVCALDDLDLDRWTGFFTDDCHYRVVSAENFREKLPLSTLECVGIGMVRDRIAALRETAVFEPRTLRHFVSSVRVDGPENANGEISAQANFVIFESLSDREPHLLMLGRYQDTLVRQAGRLMLRKRWCIFDNYRVRTSLVYPV